MVMDPKLHSIYRLGVPVWSCTTQQKQNTIKSQSNDNHANRESSIVLIHAGCDCKMQSWANTFQCCWSVAALTCEPRQIVYIYVCGIALPGPLENLVLLLEWKMEIEWKWHVVIVTLIKLELTRRVQFYSQAHDLPKRQRSLQYVLQQFQLQCLDN